MATLNRELAPMSDRAWQVIDEEASGILRNVLAGRRIADFKGPMGWETSAVDLGRVDQVDVGPKGGVEVLKRRVLPLIEIRREFEVSRTEMEALGRGACDTDLENVARAARSIALAEDNAIFNGLPGVGINGICPSANHLPLAIEKDYENYPELIARAIRSLRDSGVEGPYTIALGPRSLVGLNETTVDGFPVLSHVAKLIDGPPISAPAIDGAVVLSLRGGDFELYVGRDFAIGYLDHDSSSVNLYIDESFTFRCLGEDAIVPLVYAKQEQ